ncbi:MAG: class I tRNA ligase family protein [Dehalococcoidales bacterium]|nr:class I tRNA ligase family protein [Dehalococcoidales bacterium]
MPFVTEELWQNLKKRLGWPETESIMVAAYPEADKTAVDPAAEEIMDAIVEIIRSIRNVRAQYKVETGRWVEAQIYADRLASGITHYAGAIQSLARVSPVTFVDSRPEASASDNALVLVLKEAEVVIPMASMFDLEAEKKRIQNEIGQIQAEVARLETRLSDKDFLGKAPAAVIEKERQKLHTLTDKLERLKQQILKF